MELIICCDTDRSARDANSVLSPSYAGEKVALILPHPDWTGLTLENLKNIGGPAIAQLAKDQGLTPSEGSPDSEIVRIYNLNMVLKHLGVSCAHLQPSLNLNGPITNLILGAISGHPFTQRHPPHVAYGKGEPLMTPVEVPLYVFFAYLTFFVYSNVVL